jgi:hypothetical protein
VIDRERDGFCTACQWISQSIRTLVVDTRVRSAEWRSSIDDEDDDDDEDGDEDGDEYDEDRSMVSGG